MQSGQNDERERFIDENLRRVYDETMEEGIPAKVWYYGKSTRT